MLRTGSPCALHGLYRTTCACAETVEFVAGMRLPACISCDKPVPWVYLQPLGPTLYPVAGAEADEVETHVRKLQACLRREAGADPTFLFALGKALLRLGRIGPALEVIYGVLDHAPDNLAAHIELGRALLAFRQPRDALQVLERGVQLARSLRDDESIDDLQQLIRMVQPTAERRIGEPARRVPLDVVVTRSDALHPGIYTAINVSETGLCIGSSRLEPLGSFVALDFRLEGAEMRVYAEVVWCRDDLGGPSERPFAVGLRFLGPAPSVVQRIRSYVRGRIQEGLERCT